MAVRQAPLWAPPDPLAERQTPINRWFRLSKLHKTRSDSRLHGSTSAFTWAKAEDKREKLEQPDHALSSGEWCWRPQGSQCSWHSLINWKCFYRNCSLPLRGVARPPSHIQRVPVLFYYSIYFFSERSAKILCVLWIGNFTIYILFSFYFLW